MRNIHKLSVATGQDNIVGISKAIMVQHYQNTLLAYRNIMRDKGRAGATKASADTAIQTAFEQMQKQFQRELRMTTSKR